MSDKIKPSEVSQVLLDQLKGITNTEQFAGLYIAQAVDTGHTITDGQYGSHLIELLGIGDTLQLVEQNLGHFAWFNLI